MAAKRLTAKQKRADQAFAVFGPYQNIIRLEGHRLEGHIGDFGSRGPAMITRPSEPRRTRRYTALSRTCGLLDYLLGLNGIGRLS
jgi:hypothetical protein